MAGRVASLFEDLEEWPVLRAQGRIGSTGWPGTDNRHCTLSTAANDAERERVFTQGCYPSRHQHNLKRSFAPNL